MGRSKLKSLKETTYKTFTDLAAKLGISNQFKFNSQSSVIKWHNGSEIVLKDLFAYPSDPEFESLGSLEITGAFIDECSQVTHKAWQIVLSRCRYKLKEWDIHGERTEKMEIVGFDSNGEPNLWKNSRGEVTRGLMPKVLGTCNPSKNWTYKKFYKPNKEQKLETSKRFIQALPSDNPYLPSSYIKILYKLDKQSKERLLFGNWEYDDDPYAMCEYDKILDIFHNNHIGTDEKGNEIFKKGEKYLTCDIAAYGSDKFRIGRWNGWRLKEVQSFDKSGGALVVNAIKHLQNKYKIPQSNIVFDSDGVGGLIGGNSGFFPRAIAFYNGGKPLVPKKGEEVEKYQNAQTQMCYKLAEKINENGIYINAELSEQDEKEIIEELEWLKRKPTNDTKLMIVDKATVKQAIGRSPDWRDMMMMRMAFEYKAKKTTIAIGKKGRSYL